jgi:glycosyltransferase involved in cell wall biosynthesis
MGQVEVIVLDDGSTDGSWHDIEAVALRTGIKAVRNERNLGHVATINKLIGMASGTMVAVLDADDAAADRDALRSQFEALAAQPDVGIACGDYFLVDEAGRPIGRERVDAPEVLSSREAFRRLLLANFIPHSGTLVRRECYERMGAHDSSFHYSHDWELWLRLASRYGVAHVCRPLYSYRMHPRSLRHSGVMERTIPEFEAVLERARSYSIIEADVFERSKRRGLANARALRATLYLSRGRLGAGSADLLASVRLDPRALVSWQIPRAFASALLTALLGSRKVPLLRALRRLLLRAQRLP